MWLLIVLYLQLDFWVCQRHQIESLRVEVWQFQEQLRFSNTSRHVCLWMFCWNVLWSDGTSGPDLVLLYSCAPLLSLVFFDFSATVGLPQPEVWWLYLVRWNGRPWLSSLVWENMFPSDKSQSSVWRVVSRVNPRVILYNGHPAETLRLASQGQRYDTLHLCLKIFAHCPGTAELCELGVMLRQIDHMSLRTYSGGVVQSQCGDATAILGHPIIMRSMGTCLDGNRQS